jgi:hypothetical protein
VRWKREVPVFDQGNLGSCTGNAGIGCLSTDPFYATLPTGTKLDEAAAVDLYSAATVIDSAPGQYPPDDTGSDGLSIAKVLKSRGLISGYQHTFTFTDCLKALTNQPVIIGTVWYDSFFNPSTNGEISIDPGSTVQGGHEYVLDEIDTANGRVGFTNSWGSSWGINGRGYMSYATLQRLLAEQGDVTVFVPVTKPAPTPVPTPPAPTPSPVDDVDASLWLDLKSWAKAPHWGANRLAAAHVLDWARKRGLM